MGIFLFVGFIAFYLYKCYDLRKVKIKKCVENGTDPNGIDSKETHAIIIT